MITDKLLRVSDAQAVTASAVSTDKIDLGTSREIGEGKPLYMVFTIGTGFATLTSLTFNVVTDNDSALGSPTVLASTGAITLASGNLAAGKQHVVQIPPVIGSLGGRYLGASYTVGGSSATAGTVTADIVETVQDGMKFYPSGFSAA